MAILNKDASPEIQIRPKLTKEDIGVPTNFVHTLHHGFNDDLNLIELNIGQANESVNQQNSHQIPETDDTNTHKITKEDIGPPEHFVHTLHIGLDTGKNFSMDLEDCPNQVKDVLKHADVENQDKILKLDKVTKLISWLKHIAIYSQLHFTKTNERSNPNMQQLNHTSSQLLHEQENNTLHRLIGQKSECLSMAVIQLFFTRPPTHTQWFKESAGVLCFIKDNVRREFTFRLYNMDSNYNTVIFEEDLQAHMEYNEDNKFFHTVQTDHRIVAFNFANNYEASIMNTKVQERLQWLRSRLQNQLNPYQPRLISTPSREHLDMNYQIKNINYTNSTASNPVTLKKLTIKSKSGKISKINKNDISQPSNFVHTLHYGINMESNFALEDCPVQLRNALQDVNITNQQLQNPEIREVIRNTLDLHQMPDMNQHEYNHNEMQKEIEREENYMIRHRKVKSPQMDLLTKIKSKQFNIHNEIERKENYMVRYKTQRSVPTRESPIMQPDLIDFSMPQEKSDIRRASNSGEIFSLQIAVDQSELFSAINNRRSREDGTRKQPKPFAKLPQRQPSLKNHNRPLALPQRKDSQLTIPRPKQKTYTMTGRPLPLIPVQNYDDEKRKASQLHANKHEPPRGPPPPSPNKSPNKSPPQPPPISNAPPPPPPPPPLDENLANVQKSTDGRAALFDAIEKGSTLKPPHLSQSKDSSAGLGTSRNDLMNAIRSGKQLNPVQARNPNIEDNDVEALSTPGNDLAAALSRALKIRNVAMQSDDDSSNNETEDSDDEWDA